tara:strand:- start:550 stop:876 length:327 start_codon:yes stop_codon:yes gene_type:complete
MSRQGGWEGEIQTLAIQRRIRLVPNDDRDSANSPAFHVMIGWQHIGDAWENEARSGVRRRYMRVRIDDPFCPLDALLFPDEDMLTANLVVQHRTPKACTREKREGADE